MAGMTPEKRQAAEAEVAFRAGKLPIHEYVAAQPAGFRTEHGGKSYLSSMDGPQVLTTVPIKEIQGRHLQVYRNPGKVTHYRQLIQQAKAEGADPQGVIEPITAGHHTNRPGYYLQDGHHRVDAAEAEGLSHIPAWLPASEESHPMGKVPNRLARLKAKIRKAAQVSPIQPGKPTEPHPELHGLAQSYMANRGAKLDLSPLVYQPVDEAKAREVAARFDVARHDPTNPEVAASYKAFKDETLAQYDHLVKHGYRFVPDQDPGEGTDKATSIINHIRHHKTVPVFTGGDIPADHPLAELSPAIAADGRQMTYNEVFRGTHDVFGHALHGVRFGATGEDHAFKSHARMYSPEALPALTAETKGQNSWVHFGPHRKEPVADRPYAEQKATTMKLSRLKDKIRKAKRGDAFEPKKLKPDATSFPFGSAQEAVHSPGVAKPSPPPAQPNNSRIPPGMRSADWAQWHAPLLMDHEKGPIKRSKNLPKEVGNLMDMDVLLQSTISGRHGRHWYDENHDITHALNAHSSDPMDVFRDFGLEAAYSANNEIVGNHKLALDMKRLYQMGSMIGGKYIEPKTRDPEKIKLLLNSYSKGDAIFYPPEYPDKDLRGQLVVKRDVDEKSGTVKKMIHTDEGWHVIPMAYPVHNILAAPVMANPERFTNPHGHGTLTKKPVKVDSFLRNKLGNHAAVTVDRHEARGWGIDGATMGEGVYHLLAAGGRHLTNLMGRQELNPHHDHPIYGKGWTPARGQASRWMVMRGIGNAIRQGKTPEEAATGLKARDIYNTSSFVQMYQHPELRARLRTMIREGHVSPTFFRDLQMIEARYKPNDQELDQVVGHEALIPLARVIHKAVSAEAKAEKGRIAREKRLKEAKVTKKRLGQLIRKAKTVGFSSPNMEELDFGQALNRLKSENHQRFRQAAAGLIQRLGIHGDLHDAIGDWVDGAENSLVHHLEVPDPKVSRYIAAWMGRLGRQKGVIHFVPDPEGKHKLYQTDLPETNLGYLREQLSLHAIPFRTLVPHGQGTTVMLYDEDGSQRDNFHSFARSHNGQVSEFAGTGEFIGGDDRPTAAAKYREVIDQFERGGPSAQGGGTKTPSDNPPGPAGRRQAPEGGVVHRGQFYRGGTNLPNEG